MPRPCRRGSSLLLMALFAVIFGCQVKTLLTVMAQAAEFAFGEHCHIHFVRTGRHLEGQIVTVAALLAFLVYMVFVAEQNGACALRLVLHVAAADLGQSDPRKKSSRCEGQEYRESLCLHTAPLFFMTSRAILGGLRIKAPQTVMAELAKVPFVQFLLPYPET